MLIADENLNQKFIDDLRRTGHEVRSIAKEHSGFSDLQVVGLARSERAMVITEDKDFGELVFAHKIPDVSVVFLRYSKPEVELMRQLLRQAIDSFHFKEGRYFITIARGRIRANQL